MEDLCLDELLSSLPSSHLAFIDKLLKSNHLEENILCLYSHDLELVNCVKSYYNIGYDLVPLISLSNSDWYLRFLLDCVVNRVDVTSLSDNGLSASNIYNLACCMSLNYDIKRFLVRDDLSNLSKKEILDECIHQEKNLGNLDNRVYLVEGSSSGEFKSHCVVSPSIRFTKLLVSLSGGMSVFDCVVNNIDISKPSIVHTSDF